MLRYFFQAAFAFGMAISVFFTAPVLLDKKSMQLDINEEPNYMNDKDNHEESEDKLC